MLLKPMRFLLALAAIACAAVLPGCFLGRGESANPPAGGITAVAGDGYVTLTWQPDSGVEYWLYFGAGTSVDIAHAGSIRINVSSPYTVSGLTNGTTYAFAINGRKDGGPGGSPAVTTATPRPIGIEWTIGGTAGTADLKGISYGIGYDAVGNAGALFQSSDGITWTAAAGNWATLANGNNVNAIRFNLDRYIAVGDAGLILFSTDNTNWTAGTFAAPPLPVPKLNALASAAARMVAVGDGGAIYYSDDSAVTWNAAATVPGGTGNLYGVATSGGRWVAVGAAGTVITSSDGTNWVAVTSVTPAIAADLMGVTVSTSTGAWAAVGAGGVVATSPDGLVWTTQVVTATDLQAVAASVTGTNLFVALGKAGVAFTSLDGTTWTSRTTGTVSDLFAAVNGGGQFVAVGQAGTTINSK